MDRLIFTATTAMSEYRLDRQNMTNDLANVSTTGFKKALQVANRAVRVQGDGFDTRFLPRAFTSPLIDMTPGPRLLTARPLDVAMDNQTVLPVKAENGDIAWTRRGDLGIDVEGFLRTGEGQLVLDDGLEPIQLPLDGFIYQIAPDGSITVMDAENPQEGFEEIARLGIADGSETDFARREDGLFKPMSNSEDEQIFAPGPKAASVTSGALEGANTNAATTLVKFIDHMRSFEMQTKMISTMKENDSSGSAMMRIS